LQIETPIWLKYAYRKETRLDNDESQKTNDLIFSLIVEWV